MVFPFHLLLSSEMAIDDPYETRESTCRELELEIEVRLAY